MSTIVVAHNSYAMIRKEVAFGVNPGAPTIAPGFSTLTADGKNVNLFKPNGRKRFGNSPAAAGPFDIAGNFDPNPDPDTLFPMIALAMGSQSAPTPAPYFTSALTGSTTVATPATIPVTTGTGTRFLAGDSVILGAGTANVETVVVITPSANSFTANTTKTHASGDTAQALSPTAFVSTFSFGAALASFLLEVTRGTTWDFLGTKVDNMKLSWSSAALLAASFGLKGQTVALQGSPGTPAFSVLSPLAGPATLPQTALLNGVLYKGAALPTDTFLDKFDVSLANGLTRVSQVGSRLAADLIVGQRKANVSATMTFANDSIYDDFLYGTTGPGAAAVGVSLAVPIASSSLADPSAGRLVPYSMTVRCPNLFPTGNPVQIGQYGPLMQTFSAEAAETSGANNDLQIDIVTATSGAY